MKKLVLSVLGIFGSLSAFAQEGAVAVAEVAHTASSSNSHYLAFAAAFTIAVAVLGGAYAQGKAASVALEGIARNPGAADKLFTPMIIALALIESLVIYAFVIAFLIKP
ncbi:MAG: ATP synthase F0 subunit C [Bacteriovoracaceae bacterium]|nr:ATP synthase F0 subunit C [Bacteriovoracaceae bacterium]